MTNNLITLTIPNDDHIALRAFGKALEEMALAHELQTCKTTFETSDVTAALERLNAATGELMQAAPQMMDALRFEGDELQGKRKEPQIDTTAQQVESLGISTEVLTTLAKLESSDTSQPAQGLIQTEEGQFNLSTGEQVDSSSTPWDARIHSTSKALNADGTWRLRRKPKDMDEAEWVYFVDEVKNELMGIDAEDLKDFEESKQAIIEPTREEVDELIEASNEMLGVIEPPVTPPGDDFHSDAGVVTEQTVAGIPPIPVPPPVVVPPVPVADEAWTFPKLMVFLTNHNGKISIETVNQILSKQGMQSLKDLNGNENSIPAFVRAVQSYLETESASN